MFVVCDTLTRVYAFVSFVTVHNSCLHLLVLASCTDIRIMHGLWTLYSFFYSPFPQNPMINLRICLLPY
jgi:hypothetical protein